MNNEHIAKRAFNFDLKIDDLKKYYLNKENYNRAYTDIRKFMMENGFDHRQGSGYISKAALKDKQILSIIKELKIKLPWITKCVNKFDVTDIGKQYDLTNMIKNSKSNTLERDVNNIKQKTNTIRIKANNVVSCKTRSYNKDEYER